VVTLGDLELVHQAAVRQCDMDDGVKGGVISDPLHCEFKPSQLLCKPGQPGGCLSEKQVQAIDKVYSGPTDSGGRKLSTGGPWWALN
jgi:hypothetical protein